jgi:hypothetical protein
MTARKKIGDPAPSEAKDIIAALPEKGEKRLRAISELAHDEKNAAALAELAETEKGKCKTAAQKALARLDYKPAAALWKKLAAGKYMGEAVLMPSCSDCVSDAVAPVVFSNFSSLCALPPGTALDATQFDTFKFSLSLMLGKGTSAMQDVYRLAAARADWMSRLQRKPASKDDKPSFLMITDDFLRFWDATPDELAKIFPAVLAASIVKSRDTRLMDLAEELYAKHGGPWLIPVFMKAILTEPPESVFDSFSKFLEDAPSATLLYNVLGMIIYSEAKQENQAVVRWGTYSYGALDTRCSFGQPVRLDERWIWKLIEKPDETKPVVTMQTYNRGEVKYQDYDEMLLALLPRKTQNADLKNALRNYFTLRAKSGDGQTTLYSDALERFSQA